MMLIRDHLGLFRVDRYTGGRCLLTTSRSTVPVLVVVRRALPSPYVFGWSVRNGVLTGIVMDPQCDPLYVAVEAVKGRPAHEYPDIRRSLGLSEPLQPVEAARRALEAAIEREGRAS